MLLSENKEMLIEKCNKAPRTQQCSDTEAHYLSLFYSLITFVVYYYTPLSNTAQYQMLPILKYCHVIPGKKNWNTNFTQTSLLPSFRGGHYLEAYNDICVKFMFQIFSPGKDEKGDQLL